MERWGGVLFCRVSNAWVSHVTVFLGAVGSHRVSWSEEQADGTWV